MGSAQPARKSLDTTTELVYERNCLAEEQLLGNADYSAHADLGATFTNLRGMKIAPIDLNTVLFFLGAALLPMLPLLLLAFTPEQIFGVIKGIFL